MRPDPILVTLPRGRTLMVYLDQWEILLLALVALLFAAAMAIGYFPQTIDWLLS
jgi:hypothetical protein